MDRRVTTTEALLTWAYQRELVAAMDSHDGLWGAELGRAMTGRDSVIAVAEAAALGAIIPSTGGGYAAIKDAPPDALTLHRLVHDILPRTHRMAVAHHASRGTRPVAGELPQLVAREVRLAKGEPVYRYDRSYYKGSYPWLCDLRFDPEPKVSLAERALYRTWREGLRVVMVQLRLRPQILGRWAVSEDLPPDLPPLPAWVGALVDPLCATLPAAFNYSAIAKAS